MSRFIAILTPIIGGTTMCLQHSSCQDSRLNHHFFITQTGRSKGSQVGAGMYSKRH